MEKRDGLRTRVDFSQLESCFIGESIFSLFKIRAETKSNFLFIKGF